MERGHCGKQGNQRVLDPVGIALWGEPAQFLGVSEGDFR